VGPTPALDTDYLDTLGLRNRLPEWRERTRHALQRHLSTAEDRLPFPLPYEVAAHV
jgi:hypothetical protein